MKLVAVLWTWATMLSLSWWVVLLPIPGVGLPPAGAASAGAGAGAGDAAAAPDFSSWPQAARVSLRLAGDTCARLANVDGVSELLLLLRM